MSINDLYKLGLFIVSKNQQGYWKPADFNLSINQGSRSYQAWLLGSFQQYRPGRPVANVELGQNSVIRQRLAPTIYNYNLSIYASGFSPYPGDYLQADAMWSIYGIYRIRYSDQTKLHSYYNSVIDPIASNPIYLLEDTGFQFYPENQWMAKLSYVKEAPEIRWAFTEDSNGQAVYDPVNSIDPVWDTVACFEILTRSLSMLGVNLQAGMVAKYAEQIRREGQ